VAAAPPAPAGGSGLTPEEEALLAEADDDLDLDDADLAGAEGAVKPWVIVGSFSVAAYSVRGEAGGSLLLRLGAPEFAF